MPLTINKEDIINPIFVKQTAESNAHKEDLTQQTDQLLQISKDCIKVFLSKQPVH